jgi:hypothetical protein
MQPKPSERVGMLIVRAWLEGFDQRLVLRITKTIDVMTQPPTVSVVGTTRDLHAAVEDWLHALRLSDTAE